jgi:hypothetical protein
MLILIIVLLLLFGGGGGYYGHTRWGPGGGIGIGLGTILLIILIVYLLGGLHWRWRAPKTNVGLAILRRYFLRFHSGSVANWVSGSAWKQSAVVSSVRNRPARGETAAVAGGPLRVAVSHNTPKGLLRGSKVTRSHTTVIEAAIGAVNAAKASEHVSKIVIGVIEPTKKGKPHIKFSPVQAGLRMRVRGNTAVQSFFVYTNRPDDVIRVITDKWQER